MKISVLTPSFNSARYIGKAIQSVIVQDYQEWEHIIVDGLSTDGTQEILKKHKHLKWISEVDAGQSDAMNKAFDLATGELIVYLNVDDTFETGIFSKVGEYYRNHPDTNFLVGDLRVLDANNVLKYKHSPATNLVDILDLVNLKFPMNPVSYFYKREVQECIGTFPLDNHYSMDYWFLLRAYYQYRIDKIDLVLGNFMHTGENKSSSFVNGKTSLFRDLMDFLFETGLYAEHKQSLISCYERYLSELSGYRQEIGSRIHSYSDLMYRIERKLRTKMKF